MRAEARECLRELWRASKDMLDAAKMAGDSRMQHYSSGMRFVIRRLWHGAHGFEGAPCRHCWFERLCHGPKTGTPGEWCVVGTRDATTQYEAVEGWS